MNGFEKLKSGFLAPDSEFSPIPFWFLNDTLDERKLLSQLNDFYSKGIRGVVLHPRLGIPADTPYLGESYMNFIKICVSRARELKMKVVLYDEGMYPSGSAGGLVAKINARYRSRGIYAVLADAQEAVVPKNEKLVGVYLLKFENDRLTDFIRADGCTQKEDYVPYAFICGYTNGKIRGVHPQTDDFEENAPVSGDLLGAESVDTFIRLTHERYYGELGEFFGDTVIGFFTDEPSVTGRRSEMPDYAVWTEDFHDDYLAACNGRELLPYLLFEGEHTKKARRAHKKAVYKRLAENYYGKLSKWCGEHNVSLFGHPANSADIGIQKYFTVTGQDIVWRMVEPANTLTSPDSVSAKCSSDSARHLNRRRNSNEVFGVCGKKSNPWDFTFSDMMWYLNFLFVRGVNLIFPHAFYYSVRTSLQYLERPPDVGPNNIWWKEYSAVSSYIARLSYINTDCRNSTRCAVLCRDSYMPYKIVKPLYENQYPFNYVTNDMVSNGRISANGYDYDVLLIDEKIELSDELRLELDLFIRFGGKALFTDGKSEKEILSFLDKNIKREFTFKEHQGDKSTLRIEKLVKDDCTIYLLCNESPSDSGNTITGEFIIDSANRIYSADVFSGNLLPVYSEPHADGSKVHIKIPACRLIVLIENSGEPPHGLKPVPIQTVHVDFLDYTSGETLVGEDGFLKICYTGKLRVPDSGGRLVLHFPEVYDKANVYVNGVYADMLLMPPWETDITNFVHIGDNHIEVKVTGSASNRFGKSVPIGLISKKLNKSK